MAAFSAGERDAPFRPDHCRRHHLSRESKRADEKRSRKAEPEIEWAYASRVAPGDYPAISRGASVYFDKQFKRWVCAVQFDIVSDSVMMERVARSTWFLNLGSGVKPKSGRRTKYWAAWVRANGAPPKRGDRLSPKVFSGRLAIVRVGDTAKAFDRARIDPENAYSVVRDVIEWQTGGTR